MVPGVQGTVLSCTDERRVAGRDGQVSKEVLSESQAFMDDLGSGCSGIPGHEGRDGDGGTSAVVDASSMLIARSKRKGLLPCLHPESFLSAAAATADSQLVLEMNMSSMLATLSHD